MTLSLFQARDVAAGTFGSRLAAALAVAAGNVYTESFFSNTTAQANSGTRSLSFASIPGWVLPGASIADVSALNGVPVIPVGTVVTGTATAGGTVTVTISAPLSGTIGNGDTITFPQHTARARFANQVASQNYNLLAIALIVLSNSTLAAEGVDDQSQTNGIPDADLQFAVNSFWNLFAGA